MSVTRFATVALLVLTISLVACGGYSGAQGDVPATAEGPGGRDAQAEATQTAAPSTAATVANPSYERFEENGTWGFKDRDGVVVIQPQFDKVGYFASGLVSVQVADKWGFIDSTGRMVIEPAFEDVQFFSEGLCKAVLGGKTGWIDTTGAWVIPPEFENGWAFHLGLAAAKTGGKWGYIDQTGSFAIQPQYDHAGDFYDDGTTEVELDGVEFKIDTTGKRVE